ncbi:hypothetical protein H6P81_020642 [Aristolochia fimbriata]|uniref:Uncharacterized protein n=1 Tax=Aristolochia fimbriata TaxID=158543 RepID=A0AAV7DY73_ARIFI|nr:hypothetical protein H6P81_020642 [Aristolochia fimbriata]
MTETERDRIQNSMVIFLEARRECFFCLVWEAALILLFARKTCHEASSGIWISFSSQALNQLRSTIPSDEMSSEQWKQFLNPTDLVPKSFLYHRQEPTASDRINGSCGLVHDSWHHEVAPCQKRGERERKGLWVGIIWIGTWAPEKSRVEKRGGWRRQLKSIFNLEQIAFCVAPTKPDISLADSLQAVKLPVGLWTPYTWNFLNNSTHKASLACFLIQMRLCTATGKIYEHLLGKGGGRRVADVSKRGSPLSDIVGISRSWMSLLSRDSPVSLVHFSTTRADAGCGDKGSLPESECETERKTAPDLIPPLGVGGKRRKKKKEKRMIGSLKVSCDAQNSCMHAHLGLSLACRGGGPGGPLWHLMGAGEAPGPTDNDWSHPTLHHGLPLFCLSFSALDFIEGARRSESEVLGKAYHDPHVPNEKWAPEGRKKRDGGLITYWEPLDSRVSEL